MTSIPPVDLSNLRGITGGDPHLEHRLFEQFHLSSEDILQRLEKLGHHEASNEDEWASALHALKGIAINLGAEPLASMVDYDKNQGRMERVKKLREEQEKVLSFLAGVAADGSTGQ